MEHRSQVHSQAAERSKMGSPAVAGAGGSPGSSSSNNHANNRSQFAQVRRCSLVRSAGVSSPHAGDAGTMSTCTQSTRAEYSASVHCNDTYDVRLLVYDVRLVYDRMRMHMRACTLSREITRDHARSREVTPHARSMTASMASFTSRQRYCSS